jgi:hypothetical protein
MWHVRLAWLDKTKKATTENRLEHYVQTEVHSMEPNLTQPNPSRTHIRTMSQQGQTTTNNNPLQSDEGPPPTGQPQERFESVDSAAYFEGDDYDEYDDFGADTGGGGGGSRQNKRREDRGDSGGSGTVYSAKHVRAKEAQQQNTSKSPTHKKGPVTKK